MNGKESQNMTLAPRIKICGLTRLPDVHAAVDAGVDALGLVFYPPSSRYVDACPAAVLARAIAPFVPRVGLFVNADPAFVREVLKTVPLHLLQFHGDEDEAYCQQFERPYLKAARVAPGIDLVQYAACFPSAQAILFDALVEGYGGAGQVFDWQLIPPNLKKPIILSGGLNENNVHEAILCVRPAAVDVSSGVEVSKGIKSPEKIRAFVAAVQAARDALRAESERN